MNIVQALHVLGLSEDLIKPTSTYQSGYDPQNVPIAEIARRWIVEGISPSEEVHERSVDELLSYREYEWSKHKCRKGPVPGHPDDVSCEQRWKVLKRIIVTEGWEGKPLYFMIGLNGVVKVGNGNHRLAIAAELGLKTVPTWIYCKPEVLFHKKAVHPRVWQHPDVTKAIEAR